MKNKMMCCFVLLLIMLFSFSFARSYRMSQVPHSSKYSCNICHTNGGGSSRNSFGEDVEDITGSNNVTFWGMSLAATDSDLDGFTNGEELQDSTGAWTDGSADPGNVSLVTHPGDASDYPQTVSISIGNPNNFTLGNNYPNPFNPRTLINYYLPINSHVNIEIYNVVGEKVITLVDENASPGAYYTIWNGQNQDGHSVKSGIYFYSMKADGFSDVKRMVLVK